MATSFILLRLSLKVVGRRGCWYVGRANTLTRDTFLLASEGEGLTVGLVVEDEGQHTLLLQIGLMNSKDNITVIIKFNNYKNL